ncbi:MAG TPA: hypothetical protein VL947_07470 [Cytophagales bacterium]|nr:hypothetical protein [Cytophagales bacterium]
MNTTLHPHNPLKGLFPYEENDTSAFYMPAQQIETFLRQLHKNHIVLLWGNKGVGKTSFINYLFPQNNPKSWHINDRWLPVRIRLGDDPYKSFAYQLSISSYAETQLPPTFVEEVEQLLKTDINAFEALFVKYRVRRDVKVVLIIDPFDDLFLFEGMNAQSSALDCQRFINMVCVFEQQYGNLPIYMVITYANLLPERAGHYPKLLDLIERNKFILKSPLFKELPEIMEAMLPEQIKVDPEYPMLSATLLKDLHVDFSGDTQWLFFLQHALKRTLHVWSVTGGLIEAYKQVGGVAMSFAKHADEIYERHASRLGTHASVLDLLLRSLMDAEGNFVPKYYGHLVQLVAHRGSWDTDEFERMSIKPFIHDLADKELGFLELVRSMQAPDRVLSYSDKDLIVDNDLIVIRATSLVDRWPLLSKLKHVKSRVLNEYEWYSRMARESFKNHKELFPTTLQPYALSREDRDRNKDPEEFKIMDELLKLNETWVNDNIPNRVGLASLQDTKLYLNKGILYWRNKAQEEQQEQLRKQHLQKTRNRRIIYGLIIMMFFYVLLHQLYNEHDRMKSQLDCIFYENLRIMSKLDSIHILRLNAYHEHRSPMDHEAYIVWLNQETSAWKTTLRHLQSNMEADYNTLYDENIFSFSLHYRFWHKRCNDLSDQGALTHQKVLVMAYKAQFFEKNIKGVRGVNSPWDCDVSLPKDYVHYVSCKSCNTCVGCK